jgi:excisionase family DNA binding protein
MIHQRETLSVEETAKVLGISRSTAYELARTGEIPSLRLGRRLLVPRIGLTRLLEGQEPGREDLGTI